MPDFESLVLERLDDARFLAMNCEYADALSLIECILRDCPNDLKALRLKGNVLEQRALDEHESWPRRLALSSDYLSAQACYEQILRIDPRNTVALIDLGDHYKNVEAFIQAFKFYWNAVDLIKDGEERIGAESEIREILETCNELLTYPEANEKARHLAEHCNALLKVRGASDDQAAT